MTLKIKATMMAVMMAATGVMAQAQAAEVYTAGANMAFAPFEFVDENNQPAGFEMDLSVQSVRPKALKSSCKICRLTV